VETTFLEVASQSIQIALTLASPILILTLVAGVAVSIFQAVTSIQEQTLSFVPKIFLAAVALVFLGPWMLQIMNGFAVDVFSNLQRYVR
jgi:flagellar biosynthesis protein FliQ